MKPSHVRLARCKLFRFLDGIHRAKQRVRRREHRLQAWCCRAQELLCIVHRQDTHRTSQRPHWRALGARRSEDVLFCEAAQQLNDAGRARRAVETLLHAEVEVAAITVMVHLHDPQKTLEVSSHALRGPIRQLRAAIASPGSLHQVQQQRLVEGVVLVGLHRKGRAGLAHRQRPTSLHVRQGNALVGWVCLDERAIREGCLPQLQVLIP
mmetsp:Transcript_12849/g.45531  ORF Transcript_12849/g.45531 Transcript_12849/m.45531 type:complete len:209 (+) Transcript_12849:1124-1750(+)